MGKVKRNWDVLSKEERQQAIDDITYFFENERDEKIGIIAAGEIIDFFLQNVGMRIYNMGVEDSIVFLEKRMEDVQIDMNSLLKDR